MCLAALGETTFLTDYAGSQWLYHFRQCPDLSQILLIDGSPFFGQSSNARQFWFEKYSAMARKGSAFGTEYLPPLHMACYLDLKTWAQKVLTSSSTRPQSHINPTHSRTTKFKRTPLHYAIIGGGSDTLSLLLANGADPVAPDFHLASPLYIAIRLNQDLSVELLLDAFQASQEGGTAARGAILSKPLATAVKGKQLSIAARLLRNSAIANHVDMSDRPGFAMLQVAIINNDDQMVRTLLHHGANFCAAGFNPETMIWDSSYEWPTENPGYPRRLNASLFDGTDWSPRNALARPMTLARRRPFPNRKIIELLKLN